MQTADPGGDTRWDQTNPTSRQDATDKTKPSLITQVLLAIFLLTFFGGGLALFVSLFIPFLDKDAYAIIALMVMAEVVVLLLVGKIMQVVSGLHRLRNAAAAAHHGQRGWRSRTNQIAIDEDPVPADGTAPADSSQVSRHTRSDGS